MLVSFQCVSSMKQLGSSLHFGLCDFSQLTLRLQVWMSSKTKNCMLAQCPLLSSKMYLCRHRQPSQSMGSKERSPTMVGRSFCSELSGWSVITNHHHTSYSITIHWGSLCTVLHVHFFYNSTWILFVHVVAQDVVTDDKPSSAAETAAVADASVALLWQGRDGEIGCKWVSTPHAVTAETDRKGL